MKVTSINSGILQTAILDKNSARETSVRPLQDKNPLYNTTSITYPKNYYLLSFKGKEKTQAIKAFNEFLEKFYEKHQGENPRNIPTDFLLYDIPLTISGSINGSFVKIIKSQLSAYKLPNINEEVLVAALNKGLERVVDEFGQSSVNIPLLIQHLKDNGIISQNGTVSSDNTALQKITSAAYNEIFKSMEDAEFFFDNFLNDFYQYIKDNNKPVFDKRLLEAMKKKLDEEPFTSFNDKMLKIIEQEKINGSSDPDKTAIEIYDDMVEKKISVFDNPKIYDYVAKNDEKLDFLLEKIYGYAYDECEQIFNDSGIDKKHKVLLIDPGVGAHLEKLVKYVKEENIDTKELEPIELRKGFSDYLGTETVYRGLYSEHPKELIKKLKRDGNFASAFKEKEEAVDAIKYYLSIDPHDDNTIYSRISSKIKHSKDTSEFLSVSSFYEVAASVPKLANHFATKSVVIKTEVPKLSLIKQENWFHAMQYNQLHRTLKIGDLYLPYDRFMQKIESFVPFYLPTEKSEIVIDTKIEKPCWID